ncbi:FimB/Mfa2 family fimbrial subunit [Bacteroides fragilis]|nr:FimB/Mfa2 family fimbrial subunit [Bacteroides fragilis]
MIFVGKKNSTSFFLLISLILGLALYTALFSSCVYEDLSKCSRMFMLQPRYLLHTGEGDRFGEAVHHIDVYAFDSLGIYRKMFRDKGAHLKNGYRMPIDLPEGKWTFLCLGGKVGDYEIGIFKTGIPQQFSPAVSPGITTLSDFRVKAYFEQKENLEYSLGELFFGRPGLRGDHS